MSDAEPTPVPLAAAKKRKRESWRGVVIVAVLCGAFLWWWFTLENTPDNVGAEGLLTRSLAELEQSKTGRPLALDFDLLELSMIHLRAGNLEAAEKVAERIDHPVLQRRAWQALARGYLLKDSGSLAPALRLCDRIPDARKRAAAREEIVMEIARMGLPDVALAQSQTALLRAKVVRTMAETDAREEAAAQLPALDKLLAAAPEAEKPALQEQLAWTNLWLRHWDEAKKLAATLPEASQHELLAELFRTVRMEKPEEAKPLLESLPTVLRMPLRLEAARLNGKIDQPAALISELRTAAENVQEPAEKARASLLAARVSSQLLNEPEAWKPLAESAEKAIAAAPLETQVPMWLELGTVFNDAMDTEQARLHFASARAAALKLPPSPTIDCLANLLEAAFRNSEPQLVQQTLDDLRPLLDANTPSLGAVTSIAVVLFREGAWADALTLIEKLPANVREPALEALSDLPIESSAGPGFAISQDRAFKDIRQVAASQGETEAAKLAMRLKPGVERSRAWLEIAKGLIVKQVIDDSLKASPAAPPPGSAP